MTGALRRFLSLKPDLVDAASLHIADEVSPLPWAAVRAILLRDLGSERLTQFERIEEMPVGSVPASQTHRAWIGGGIPVLIRIAHPAAEIVRGQVHHGLRKTGVRDRETLRDLAVEFAEFVRGEADLRRERENLERLRRNNEDESSPQGYPTLSGPSVLTVEAYQGTSLAELMLAGANPDAARTLARCVVRGIFRDGFYNRGLLSDCILLLRDGRISFARWTLIGDLDESERRRQLQLLLAVYRGDLDEVTRRLASTLVPGSDTDVEHFRRGWLAAARDYVGLAESSRNHEVPGRWLVSLLRVARKHGMWMPARAAELYRSLLALETIMRRLDPACSPATIIRDLLTEERELDASRLLKPANLRSALVTLLAMLHDAPGDLHNLISQVADGSFRLRTYVTEAGNVRKARRQSARLVTTAILCVCFAVLLTAPRLPLLLGVPLAWPLSVTLILLLGAVCVQWVRLR